MLTIIIKDKRNEVCKSCVKHNLKHYKDYKNRPESVKRYTEFLNSKIQHTEYTNSPYLAF